MSKKRGKSSSAPGQGGTGRWESDLINAPLEEENWKVCVVFIVENQPDDAIHITALESVVKIPQRRHFSYVHKDELMALVDEIGNPKTRKAKELPKYFEITEFIKGLMDAGEEIPIHLWAKLIKFGLLNAKDADMKKRETEAKAKEEKGKGSGKGKRPRSKSGGKGGKGKKTPEPQLPKKDWSTMKKRGEEDTENKYIDDEPDDGPNHYIFVSGFRQPQLFPLLTELGINVSSVIKLYSESYETMENVRSQMQPPNDAAKDEEVIAAENSRKQQNEKELAMFWKLLPVVLQRTAPNSTLQDLARLEYVVTDSHHPSDWTDAENMIAYGTAIFEDIACLVYDSLDWRRQYLNYLKNMNLLHVPTRSELESIEHQPSSSTEPVSISSATAKREKGKAEATSDELVPPIIMENVAKEVDMRYYSDLMDLVPQESVSVPLIMHCMLEQVVATEEDIIPPSEIPRMQRGDGIHLSLADCISDALENLALTEEERKALAIDFPSIDANYREEVEEKKKKALSPTLMQYGDNMTVRTHHLAEFHSFNPKSAEEALLRRLPSARLWNYEKPGTFLSKERAARLHELLRHAASLAEGPDDIIPETEMDHAFRQFVFETINLSAAAEDGTIAKAEKTQGCPWDDPYTDAVRQQPAPVRIDLALSGDEPAGSDVEAGDQPKEGDETVKTADDHPALKHKRNLDSWCFSEHFHPEVLLQVLTEASEMYPSLDTYHHKRDNSLLAVFHCPMNKKLQASESWSTSLHSDVGFRNYLEYVSESIQDWTKDEEAKYQAEQLKKELERLATQTTTSADASATTPPPSTGAGKRPRSKSPKKGSRRGSASRSSSKVGPSADEQSYSSPYIRAGSLKAQNEDQAKLREEEERRKAEKDSKQQARVKSAEKGKQAKSASSKTSQDGKRPGSGKGGKGGKRSPRSKSQSRSRSRSGSREREKEEPQETSKPEEPSLPFLGYDVGNKLINLYGKTNYLYPCDGGIIKAEKVVQEQGTTYVSTTMKKDGHTFVIHMIDPKNPEEDKELDEMIGRNETPAKEEVTEKAELESTEKEKEEEPPSRRSSQDAGKEEEKECHSKFGSWNAVLCDGMTLSFSSHGENGECSAADKVEQNLRKFLGEIPPATSPSPIPPGMETPKKGGKGKKSPRGRSPRGKSPKGKRKSDSDKEADAQREEEARMQEELERKLQEAKEEEERRRVKLPPFNQLYASTPDGLSVRYQLDPTTAGTNYLTDEPHFKLMVRQSYPYKTSGKQKTESLRAQPAMEEVSRCIRSDGTVIKVKKDGSSMILFADGTTCFNQGSGPLVQERKVPVTPHSMPSAVAQQLQSAPAADEQRTTTASPGSKKGSKGRKSSGKTNPETTTTEPSLAGTAAGGGAGGLTAAAGLEADAGASAEADLEKASSWHTIRMDGESFVTKPSGETVVKDRLLCYMATDPVTGEVLMSREDHVIRIERPDGSVVCEHSDGTRISQYTREIEKPLYEMEAEDEEPSVMSVHSVRHVRVECPGYATVSFNCDEGSCLTVFGSGTNLLTIPDSSYQMSHWSGGRIDIDREGSVTYTPRPDNDLYGTASNITETEEGINTNMSVAGDTLTEGQVQSLGSYVMRHNSEICCEAIDHEGNVFQVRKDGEVNVINPSIETTSGGESVAITAVESPLTSDPLDHHPPRFFIIHSDGTGTELLRFKDVQEYLADAELDPTTAVIKEPLPDTPGVVGITVMRPHYGNSSEAWMCQKMEEKIVPQNLRTRDLSLFPHRVEKKPGPQFAKTVGKGLAVGSAPSIPELPPVPPCPSFLELRQLVQYKPITSELRETLKKNLIIFGEYKRQQDMERKAYEVQDPRTSEEKVRASDLLTLVLEFDENQQSPKSPMGVPQPSGRTKVGGTKATAVQANQSPAVVRAIYEEAVTPPPIPKPDPPRDKLTQEDWDRIKRSIEEEKLGRQALKYRDVPPYFESEEGRAWLMSQAPDMEAMSRQLAPDPRTDGSEARMSQSEKSDSKKTPVSTNAPGSEAYTTTPSQSRASENGASNSMPVSDTPSKTRPTNPTPAHASGKGTPTKVRPENPTPIAASQASTVRPSNPTPSHAYAGGASAQRQANQEQPVGQFQPSPIPENPTSAQIREGLALMDESSSNDLVVPMDTSAGSDLVLTRSLLYDVRGKPRKDKVRLPASILSDKPATVPNKQFMSVEEPVRRKVKTSSVAQAVTTGTAKRGFNILPPEIVFGVLREGNTYSYTARLKNTGIDTCRFKVKQPPPGTGLRVHYLPGPVAAGMDTLLHVECYAIAVGVEGDSGVGTINHQLEIVTETETLYLPISAIVLTGHDYDNRTQVMPPGGKAPGVKLLSAKPPSREGIVRPMKINA